MGSHETLARRIGVTIPARPHKGHLIGKASQSKECVEKQGEKKREGHRLYRNISH